MSQSLSLRQVTVGENKGGNAIHLELALLKGEFFCCLKWVRSLSLVKLSSPKGKNEGSNPSAPAEEKI